MTAPRPPQDAYSTFAKMDPTVEACEGMSVLIMPWYPPYLTPKGAFLHVCRQGSLPDLRSGHLISLLQQSSASATSFVLGECLDENNFSFTPLDKHQLSIPWAHLSATPSHLVSLDCFASLVFMYSPNLDYMIFNRLELICDLCCKQSISWHSKYPSLKKQLLVDRWSWAGSIPLAVTSCYQSSLCSEPEQPHTCKSTNLK